MPTIEPVFVVEPTYAPDAAERREPIRPQHLARVEELTRQGRLLVAGAYADMSASLLVLRVEDEAAAVALVHEDVYWREGVWTDVAVRRLNRVVVD
ncbi:MAG TPA: YciI family protein [Egibacteraceae bacterium]|nr:YciI family protein [Egibacteraceae bacterium]